MALRQGAGSNPGAQGRGPGGVHRPVPLIHSNGLTLNAFELGEGPPVVMLHGLLAGSSASWYFTSAPTLASQFHLLLYDLRGHGRSSRASRGYGTATMVQDLGGLLDGMGWQEPVS